MASTLGHPGRRRAEPRRGLWASLFGTRAGARASRGRRVRSNDPAPPAMPGTAGPTATPSTPDPTATPSGFSAFLDSFAPTTEPPPTRASDPIWRPGSQTSDPIWRPDSQTSDPRWSSPARTPTQPFDRVEPTRARPPVTVPPVPVQPPDPALGASARPGRRARRPERRRARGLGGTIGITSLTALVPGAGFLWTGRKLLGSAVLLVAVLLVLAAAVYVPHDVDSALDFAVDPGRLQTAATVLVTAFLGWAAVVASTYVMVRPKDAPRWQTLVATLFVGVLCLGVAAPVTVAAQYARTQSDLVATVFGDNESATTPDDVTEEDPWGGRDRVNLLLLGGDGGVHRDGVRTDSMVLVSMDTETGKTVMFSLPRNMMNAQFPEDSPLHDLYPDGFRGEGDAGNWMLNAVYRQVPILHPGVLGRSDNEGADALKQAIAGSTGIRVDYYLLVNLAGFQEIVDAMGGVTVNINEPVPIGGITDLGVEPDDWLEPGPDQHLDGFEALWFSRGRYGSDDYERMERQRCMIDAIIDEADPVNLIRRYQALAEVGKEIVRTDIPRELLPDFVDLAQKVKDAKVRSVVFRSSDAFYPGDPDFDYMQSVVAKALDPPRKKKQNPEASEAADDPKDVCAYDPAP